MVADILQSRDSIIKTISILFLSLFLYSCGGGGGGGSTAASSSSSNTATAINWTASGSSSGPTAYHSYDAASVSSDSNNICTLSAGLCIFGGADVEVNASTDSITFNYEASTGSYTFISFEFPASSILSNSTNTSTVTLDNAQYNYCLLYTSPSPRDS